MASGGSVTRWIKELKAGDELALDKLWKRYWPRLVRLARERLSGAPSHVADEEDVAQDAFWGFYRAFKAGRLPRLDNRQQLMALLIVITIRRAASQIEHDLRQKRGAGLVQDEPALQMLASGSHFRRGVEQVPDDQPSAEEQAMLRDEYRHYVGGLADDLRPIAELYLAGYSNSEIAKVLGCVRRTIERKLPIILDHWQRMAVESVNRESGQKD